MENRMSSIRQEQGGLCRGLLRKRVVQRPRKGRDKGIWSRIVCFLYFLEFVHLLKTCMEGMRERRLPQASYRSLTCCVGRRKVICSMVGFWEATGQ
jgi:hypothetical protein